ncbi:nicotinate-nucleotide pyrophosphorylase (carboxylating) [Streptomyces olivoverticillatus]|uniref:L-aspartate oxidase n=2 Tax=Streptomyces olivoverticillatus TaxID=66427 RepID=A0A7W7LQF4_9ACTN|nr:nicotinate-nucleotide pyrophosphorylase (carboxylating) [Streptomyces olivoverticillatus]
MTGIRLTAPRPGWSVDADVVVIGSGVAGLTVALRCAAAGAKVTVVTKALLDDGSTRWAQGGIAAALGEGDTPAQHLDDTLVAGAGLCSEEAVHALVTEGPDAVRRLIATGARFDTDAETGEILLTREGGHHRRRIAHAGGDATGAEISRALVEAVRDAGIETIEHALVLDLLKDADGRAAGVSLHVMGEGQHDGVGAVRARAVVLATGGMGQVFSATTNPAVSTGDGVALALRAGAEVSDLEFVQFHPTVLWLGPDVEGQQPLVSEAVRGEGAHLVDADGHRFMVGAHELAELAPRDIVAKGITRRMQELGAEHMYLDARHFGARMWEQRFPTILAACRAHGIDPVTEPIPVAPAAHYASGGVRTDLQGRTTVPGLYACGEVACTGVHGANRLASNSLLEGLVFAERIAADAFPGLTAEPARPPVAAADAPASVLIAPEQRIAIQRVMTHGAGVLRSRQSLEAAAAELARIRAEADGKSAEPGTEAWEATNLLLVSQVLVASALRREETRGCHWREDHPERDDAAWRRHLLVTLRPDRTLAVSATESAAFPPVTTPEENSVSTSEDPALHQIARPGQEPGAASGGCGDACGCAAGDVYDDAMECGLDPQLVQLLEEAGLNPLQIEDLAHLAIEEDLDGGKDVTTFATVPADAVATGDFTAREDGTVAGLRVAEAILSVACTDEFEVERHVEDGDRVVAGQKLLTVRTRTRDLLTAERSMLNIMCRLSGIATATRAWADALEGTGAAVRDTRKTTVGLRALEKYAVRCGGGVNHRMSLSDAALVKDNHVIAAGGVAEAFKAVRLEFPELPIEVEVDRIDQILPVLDEGADLIMLDNFTPEQTREAVALVAGRSKLESSGRLTLANARAYAETGVDYLAVGALTHSSPILDIGLDLRDEPVQREEDA